MDGREGRVGEDGINKYLTSSHSLCSLTHSLSPSFPSCHAPPSGPTVALRGAHFGIGRGEILLDDVACIGNETMLINCAYDDTPFCFHSEDAGVICPIPG